jgi:hypothetical protein
MYKDKVSTKMSKIFFLSMCDVKVFLTFGADLTIVLPVFSSIVVNTVIVTARNFEP